MTPKEPHGDGHASQKSTAQKPRTWFDSPLRAELLGPSLPPPPPPAATAWAGAGLTLRARSLRPRSMPLLAPAGAALRRATAA